MEELYDLIRGRATCRSYRPDPIPGEVLDRVLEAGCRSPSSGGFQAISIIKITDPALRRRLVAFSRGQKFLAVAPVSLVFCVDYHRIDQVTAREPAPFRLHTQFQSLVMGVTDAAICAQTVALAAQGEGLGSCYNGNILNKLEAFNDLLGLPERVFPVVMLTLGYPRTAHRQPPKYPAALLVHENGYRERTGEEVYAAYRRQNRWQKLPPKREWVERCCAMAEALQGADYAAAVRRDIEEKGYLSPYQYWFGCYYLDEPGDMTNRDYLAYFRKQGFAWLEEKERITHEKPES